MSVTALAATAFAMGLAGAAHCTTMCGGPCMAVTGSGRVPATAPGHRGGGGAAPVAVITIARATPLALPTPMLAFLAARTASYALLGALVAASVSGLAWLGDQVAALRPFWVLLHVGVLVLGLALLVRGRQPGWLVDASRRLSASLAPDAASAGSSAARGWAVTPVRRAAAAGLAWGALPCGLLQSALVVAALASSPLGGAGVMVAFAGASSLGLVAAPALWRVLRRIGPQGEIWVTRLAGLMLVLGSVGALWMFSTSGLAAALCVV